MESAPHNLVHSRICQEIDQIMMALRTDITNFEEDSTSLLGHTAAAV